MILFSATTLEKALKSYKLVFDQRRSDEGMQHMTTTEDETDDDEAGSADADDEGEGGGRPHAVHEDSEKQGGEGAPDKSAPVKPAASDEQPGQDEDPQVSGIGEGVVEEVEEVEDREPSDRQQPAPAAASVMPISVDEYDDVDIHGESSGEDPTYHPPSNAKSVGQIAKTNKNKPLQVESAGGMPEQPSPIKQLVPIQPQAPADNTVDQAAEDEFDARSHADFWSDLQPTFSTEQQEASSGLVPNSSRYSEYLSLMYQSSHPLQPFEANASPQMGEMDSLSGIHRGLNELSAFVQSNFKILRIQVENANRRNLRENHFQLFSGEFFQLAEKIIFRYLVPYPLSSWDQCGAMKTILGNNYIMLLYVSIFLHNIYLEYIILNYIIYSGINYICFTNR